MVYKFNKFEIANSFCDLINKMEGYPISEDIVKYCEPNPTYDENNVIIHWTVVCNDITSKYFDDFNNSKLPNYTPPILSNKLIALPDNLEILFPNDQFILHGFVVQLERVNNTLAIDVAYIEWLEFQEELDKPENEAIKRQFLNLWEFVVKQKNEKNFL
jgi:hypothetical protein